MSAVFCDGFDTYASYGEKWTVIGGTADPSHVRIDTVAARNGGQSLGITGNANTAVGRVFPSGASATCFFHVAMRRTSGPGQAANALVQAITARSNNTALAHASLRFFNDGNIDVRLGDYNGAFPIGSTLVGVTPVDTWFHIGWRITVHDSLGSLTIWYNGTQIYTISNVDTQASPTYPTIDSISFYGHGGTPAGTAYQRFDDLVVLNSAGSINNSYLGDVAVITLRPSGAGDRTELTPVGGATNWDNVNEPVHTGLDYNASDTVGQGDLYALENLPASVGVSFVQHSSYARKDTTAAKSLAHLIKVGGVEYAQSAVALSQSFVQVSNVIEQNPAGGAWSSNVLNSAQIGVEVRA
jgi:hypothetical protein